MQGHSFVGACLQLRTAPPPPLRRPWEALAPSLSLCMAFTHPSIHQLAHPFAHPFTPAADYDLQVHNTFGIACRAAFFASIATEEELRQAIDWAKANGKELLVLGGGSNVLFCTPTIDKLVLSIAIEGIEVLEEDEASVLLGVGAGIGWHALVLHAVAAGYYGIENLSLIPGRVGAAPMQNIGAYGQEVRQTIEWVQIFDLQTLQIRYLNNAECRFGYRESIFKHELLGQAIITKVAFRLQKHSTLHTGYGDMQAWLAANGIIEPTLATVSQAVIAIRQSKLPDPADIGNAGSFFKNPEIDAATLARLQSHLPNVPTYPSAHVGHTKVPAGYLIEQAGWKGHRQGAVGVHARQALVLVNYGGAKGSDVLALAEAIVADVLAKYGVALSMEVNRIDG